VQLSLQNLIQEGQAGMQYVDDSVVWSSVVRPTRYTGQGYRVIVLWHGMSGGIHMPQSNNPLYSFDRWLAFSENTLPSYRAVYVLCSAVVSVAISIVRDAAKDVVVFAGLYVFKLERSH
jgi:hypothetical protein